MMLAGNYGVPDGHVLDRWGLPAHFESSRVQVSGLVVCDYSGRFSHWQAVKSLGAWLREQGVPALCSVDTRALTKVLREHGTMLGKIEQPGETVALEDPNLRNLVAEVSCASPRVFNPGKSPRIVAFDCGIKYNIIRCLLEFDVELTVVPFDYPLPADHDFDGVFLSNGPGDPTMAEATIGTLRGLLSAPKPKPIFGICMGNQLMALAAGAKTYKMPYGNRGANQPCVDLRTTRCYITPQNHGFAVDASTLPEGWRTLFLNANDFTNEGITHSVLPFYSVQFHPEACSGPTDTRFLFKDFVDMVRGKVPAITTVDAKLYTNRHLTFRKILLLGSGGLSIGQAGEFDYSGSQAIKALKEEGIQSVLINPNIATVQTSEGMADRVYFLPVNAETVESVIRKERPDGLIISMGGQTALNVGIELFDSGVLDKYGVKVLGTPISVIKDTEDRELFAVRMAEIDEHVALSFPAVTVREAVVAAERIGYPVLVRAAYALGGLGSGFASNEEELVGLASKALAVSPQILLDQDLRGWKEIEYEVVRDAADNCITVCNMENFDPLGVHTGDSIVIAPSQTLSNKEYFMLRETAIKVVRHLGIVGECNIQYALDPHSLKYCIIEVNARLSRSSALASKATGYPLAYVAAKLILGSDLVSLRNSVTKTTTACFEPALDYVVVKVPRWDLRKFSKVSNKIGSQMKSVGEVMSIGRTFEEAIQKAIRMVNPALHGFEPSPEVLKAIADDVAEERAALQAAQALSETVVASPVDDPTSLEVRLRVPSDTRLLDIALAFERGFTVERIHALSKIDPWFLSKLHRIATIGRTLEAVKTVTDISRETMRQLKRAGFSDWQIASRVLSKEQPASSFFSGAASLGAGSSSSKTASTDAASSSATMAPPPAASASRAKDAASSSSATKDAAPLDAKSSRSNPPTTSSTTMDKMLAVRAHRIALGVLPAVKQIDTLAAEFPAQTNYLYMTYAGDSDDVTPSRQGVIVLGCGPYCIGSSVEFDWSSVSCVRALRDAGKKAIVVNYNPETVSTDYDESDRLYFEELSLERVMDIYEREVAEGVIVSVGGQIPNNLAVPLHNAGVTVLGTSPENIDRAEDRHKFSKLLDKLGVDQPEWAELATLTQVESFVAKTGLPVIVRPSYVLSGAAMRVAATMEQLKKCLKDAADISPDHPVVVSRFIENAKEVEFDAVARKGKILNYAISEHVENAGVHSGDATLVLPAQKLYVETIRQVKRISSKIAAALDITGPFNIQFISKDNAVKVIECNLRASRTFPFVSKTFRTNFITIATRAIIGVPVQPAHFSLVDLDYVGVKAPQFSFSRLQGADPTLGVEMMSTGEVACFGQDVHEAYLRALVATRFDLPRKDKYILVSVTTEGKKHLAESCKTLVDLGYKVAATEGTHQYLQDQGVPVTLFHKPSSKAAPSAIAMLQSKDVCLVINEPNDKDREGISDGYLIRRAAVDFGASLVTNVKCAVLLIAALAKREASGGAAATADPKSMAEYYSQDYSGEKDT
jgi:carbamoyl-phosphate synthase small subunit